ncbi:tyrosine-type recombinase/integrase, partial [uncultured Aminobacterium sp.]|uniref:tyrosine-type recombinase/integrase n=1 Tax=uncultured Aminobacterium sp. TaxID=548265 RepID=UPI00259390C0
MAEIRGLKPWGPGKWRGRVQLPGSRKQKSKIFYGEKMGDVKEEFIIWKAGVMLNYKHYLRKEKTIEDLACMWLDELDIKVKRGKLRQNTRDSYYYALQRIIDQIGDREPEQLTVEEIQDLINFLEDQELSATYVRYHIRILSMLMIFAIGKQYISSNRVEVFRKRLDLPEVEDEKPKIIEDNALAALIREAEEENNMLARAIEFASETGLRRAELLGLRYSDINSEDMIELTSQLSYNGTKNIHLKTKYSKRDIPLTTRALDILAEIKQWQKEQKIKRGEAYKKTGYVFTDEIGAPFKLDYLTRFFSRTAKKLTNKEADKGTDEKIDLSEHTFHTTRHTYASNLIRAGVNIKVVSELLGHHSGDCQGSCRFFSFETLRI